MQIPRLIRQHYLIASIAVGVLALALIFGGGAAMEGIGSYLASSKILKLETEKQSAKEQVIKLQGQVEAKDAEIGRLNEQISQSNERVVSASKRTTAVQTDYNKVRASGPTFNSVDDSERVNELRAILDFIYSDS